MVYTSGSVLANFLAVLSLISAFIVGLFDNNPLWLLLAAALIISAYWTKKYKSTGKTAAKPVEFVIALLICGALFFVGRFVGSMAAL